MIENPLTTHASVKCHLPIQRVKSSNKNELRITSVPIFTGHKIPNRLFIKRPLENFTPVGFLEYALLSRTFVSVNK